MFHLGRHLNRSNIRVLALEPGGPKALSSVPNYDPATKAALVDPIDPAVLGPAFGKLRGQTVLVTGRVEGDMLYFKPSKGAESKIALATLGRAAESADVSLVVLQSSVTRQPGGRNWLWQTVSVSGLDDALKRATFGDFLNALAAGRGELVVSARPSAAGRVTLTANPSGASAVPMTDAVGNWFSDTAGELMGNVVVQGVQAYVPDRERVEELDARIIPWCPRMDSCGLSRRSDWRADRLGVLARLVEPPLAARAARGIWYRHRLPVGTCSCGCWRCSLFSCRWWAFLHFWRP